MPGRLLRGSLLVAVLGFMAPVAGCGGGRPESGGQIKVDKEKEAALTKAMEQYYMKKQAPAKKKGR